MLSQKKMNPEELEKCFAEERNTVPEFSREEIEAAAEKSFAFLPFAEDTEKEEKNKTFSFTAFFEKIFRPALGLSFAAIAVIIAVVLVKTDDGNTLPEETVAVNKPMPPAEAISDRDESALPIAPGTKESGTEIKLPKAEIKVLAKTDFKRISDTDISMESGKAKFDVVTGTDFRITVDSKFLVRVLGTSFTLDYSDGKLSAEVFSGLVEVVELRSGKTTSLPADTKQLFTDNGKNFEGSNELRKQFKPKKEKDNKNSILTPGQSFLFQGREALKAGKTGAAQELFQMEIAHGKEPDKALFELVSIYETKKDYAEIAALALKHKSVIKGSKVYREELMVKGCISQKKSGDKTLSLCREYLHEFPRSFRSKEIKEILDEK